MKAEVYGLVARAISSTLGDVENRYNKAVERTALLEQELVDKARLEEELQRMKDELRGKSRMGKFTVRNELMRVSTSYFFRLQTPSKNLVSFDHSGTTRSQLHIGTTSGRTTMFSQGHRAIHFRLR